MGVLSGLGRAIGSAAVGYGAGQARGEAEGYRRSQQTAANDYKKEILKYQQARLDASKNDPDHLGRELAKSLALEHSKALNDPQNADWWNRHPKLRAQYAAEAQDAFDVASGVKSPRDFNPIRHGAILDAFHGPGGGDEETPDSTPPLLSTPGALAGVGTKPTLAEAPRVAAIDQLAAAPGPQVGMTPVPPLLTNSQIQIPPRRELPPPTFGTVPPHVLANEVLQDFPDQRMVGPAPTPPTAAPATASAAPSAPPVPKGPPPGSREYYQSQIISAYDEKPRPIGDNETDKNYQKYLDGWYRNQDRNIARLTALQKEAPRAALLAKQIAGYDTEQKSKQDLRKDLGGLARERTTTEQQTRPLKKSNIASMIAKRSSDTNLSERKFTYQQKQDRIGNDIKWMNAQTARAAQEGRQPYLDAMTEKAKYLLAHADDPIQRAALSAAVRLFTASRGILDDPQLDQEGLDAAGEQIDAIAEQMTGKGFGLSKKGGTPTPAPGPKTITPKAYARAGAGAKARGSRADWLKKGTDAGLKGPFLADYLKSKGF